MDLSDPGIEPRSPALQADSLSSELSEKSDQLVTSAKNFISIRQLKAEKVYDTILSLLLSNLHFHLTFPKTDRNRIISFG